MKAFYVLPLTLAVSLSTTAVYATGNTAAKTPTVAPAANSANLTHNDYVTLSGSVARIMDGDEFELNYGSGMIKVDTNDTWPELFKAETNRVTNMLKTGDRVTVTGRVDKNWLTANEIEAEVISLSNGNSIVTYRNPASRNSWLDRNLDYFREGGRMSLTGTVTEVKNDHEFILQYGGGTIQIDTDGVNIPSASRIAVGERVTVYGTYDKGLFERNEIQAEAIDRGGYYTRASR
ncbi:MAG: NirD/YgiW/YdeI family stress tolerance protein [Alphaproteobacteria bacterium]|nr:NirD/YgiW/YdeI family stress tolerance protein [Alphaproteobacteria bacterium]